MKYKVKTQFVFEGEFEVEARSSADAEEMMEKTRGEGLYFFKSGKEKYRMELDEFGRANYDFYIYYKG